jgi:hypothetical protein
MTTEREIFRQISRSRMTGGRGTRMTTSSAMNATGTISAR